MTAYWEWRGLHEIENGQSEGQTIEKADIYAGVADACGQSLSDLEVGTRSISQVSRGRNRRAVSGVPRVQGVF